MLSSSDALRTFRLFHRVRHVYLKGKEQYGKLFFRTRIVNLNFRVYRQIILNY